MGRPRLVVVVLVVSTFVEVCGVVVALVSAGGAMGGGVIDGPVGCAGSDPDSVGAVAAVMWTLVHRGWWR